MISLILYRTIINYVENDEKKEKDYDYPKIYPNHLVTSFLMKLLNNNVIFFFHQISHKYLVIFSNIVKEWRKKNWYILKVQGISCTFDIDQYLLSIGMKRDAMFARRHTRDRPLFRCRPTVLVVHSCNLTLNRCIMFSLVNVVGK